MKAEYLKKIETVQFDDLDMVLQTIRDYLDDESLSKEQKLYALGYLINKNKEQYIITLKQKIEHQKIEIKRTNKLEQLKQQKKKVFVVRKKTV